VPGLDQESRTSADGVAVGLVVATVFVLAAGWLPIGEMTPWAQLVAFRTPLGAGLLILAAVLGLLVRLAGQRRTVASFAVHDVAGTDHRALLATVTP
jgi:hypothetical protein